MSTPSEKQRKEIDDLRARLAETPGVAERAERLTRAETVRDALLQAMSEFRERQHLSQEEVARRMATSQPAVARLEAGLLDPRLSTLEKYAAAIGYDLNLGPAVQFPMAEVKQTMSSVADAGLRVAKWLKTVKTAPHKSYEGVALQLAVQDEHDPHQVVGYVVVHQKHTGVKLDAVATEPDIVLDAVKGIIRESGQAMEIRLDTQAVAET